jgi:molecular chaperone HscB
VHPDRFAAEGATAQRLAMQWAVRVNEAYQRLKDPLSRAAYLCEQRGVPINAERNTAMPTAFLMQQMQWREALEDAASAAAVATLDEQVAHDEGAMMDTLTALLDEHNNTTAAAAQVRALMFVARFRQDIERRLDTLDANR